jgi:hypothetical protein
MTRRTLAFLLGAAVACLLLAVFQVWYVALPFDDARHVDFCRWSRHLDCFESLHRHGDLAALAGLAGLFFLETLVLAAGAGDQPRRDAWLAVARLASIPASGLAVYVLLNDYLVAKQTSPTSVAIALLSMGATAHGAIRGPSVGAAKEAGMGALAAVAGSALLGFFLHGAAGAAQAAEKAEAEIRGAPPAVHWASFDAAIPREGAAALGNTRAPTEILLFLDPAQDLSRRLLREALEFRGDDVLLLVYLPGVALASDARAYLETVALAEATTPPPETEAGRILAERTKAAAKVLEFPTAIWKGGRTSGDFRLAKVLAAARAK